MNINITNISGVPQEIANIWIEPDKTIELPVEIALRYQKSRDLFFDWDAAAKFFKPSTHKKKLTGLAFATPLSLFDGYGLIGVYTVREFLKQGIDLDLYKAGWLIEQDLDSDIMELINRPKQYYNVAIAKGPPNDVLPVIPARNRISYGMWESTTLPPDWVPVLNELPLVLVPTQAQVQVYQDSGVTTPIHVVPDPIDTDYWSERTATPEEGLFKIVSWSRMTSRKMPIEMVMTFMRAFPKADYPHVRFELKTSGGNFGAGRHMPDFNDSRITVHDGRWSLDDLREWVSSADCAYFLSHGEGMFNPPMQSMCLGIPTILPNHSGPADFSDERYNYPIDLEGLVESPMGNDMLWWNPSLDHATERLQEVYNNYDEALARAKRGKAMIRRRYNVPLFVERLTKEVLQVAS